MRVFLPIFVGKTELPVDRIMFMFWEYFFLFLSACEALTEWEYLPPVGPRPPKGFVGLKNAGATCYMNSVIQQLYMIPSIRNSILAIEGTGSDIDDDMFSDEKQDNEVNFNYKFWILCVLISFFFLFEYYSSHQIFFELHLLIGQESLSTFGIS